MTNPPRRSDWITTLALVWGAIVLGVLIIPSHQHVDVPPNTSASQTEAKLPLLLPPPPPSIQSQMLAAQVKTNELLTEILMELQHGKK